MHQVRIDFTFVESEVFRYQSQIHQLVFTLTFAQNQSQISLVVLIVLKV